MLRRQQHLPISNCSSLPPDTECGASRAQRRGAHQLAPRERSERRGRAGFTLVEMMVAVVILAVGLLGLTTTGAYVVRMVSGGQQQTLAASVAQSRLEYLRSLPCASIPTTGTATTRGIKEQWKKGATNNQVLFIDYNVKYSVAGSARSQNYTFTMPCW